MSDPKTTKLSIIIPCYNEEATITTLLDRVWNLNLNTIQKEIIVVDDGSKDQSTKHIQSFITTHPKVQLLSASRNKGKGAAIRRGFAAATGDLVVIQDADLEYDPHDWEQMLALFKSPKVQVVFGSRRLLKDHSSSGFSYYWGAQSITMVTNLMYGAHMTDMFTCYKMFRRSFLNTLQLQSNGFDIEAELAAKTLRRGATIYEVPISYHPRSIANGKKIRWQDGVGALWQSVQHRFTDQRNW